MFKGTLKSMALYKGIFLHFIPAHIIVSWDEVAILHMLPRGLTLV